MVVCFDESMPREVKFRAWTGTTMEYNVIAGKFGVFYVNPGTKGDGLNEEDTACLTPFNTIYSPNTPLMQFTGLKDKNGKEIYEGDILLHKALDIRNVPVIWWGSGWYVGYDDGKYHNVTALDYLGDCEVIGNIYENPELLTK